MHVWPLYGSVLGAVTLRSFLATDRALRSAAIVLSADWFASNALRFLDAFDYRLLFRDSDLALCVGFLLA